MTQTNLGGKGPDNGEEKIIVAGLGTYQGKMFDMQITSTSDRYSSQFADYNSVYIGFGYITMDSDRAGSALDLKFTIVEAGTSTPMALPMFYFSFFDFDQSQPLAPHATGGSESLAISGYESYYITNETELAVGNNSKGQTTFSATKVGGSDDNPTAPMTLTKHQQNKAVTFKFENTSSFEATMQVSPNAVSRGREVYFSGKTNLATNPCTEKLAANDPKRQAAKREAQKIEHEGKLQEALEKMLGR